jgi:hypothetical protein
LHNIEVEEHFEVPMFIYASASLHPASLEDGEWLLESMNVVYIE